ncbi:glycosyltransferase [Vulcanococcus sp. Clear-D1]|uniref:glycosyltransferase n=1 Tax=Vulcanococcus sp. Clear-D1 TaxID=2766970 RepID=UPI0019853EE5|nr:glycosyltransferase [Vulcanococcus sp. Clear-D1]MBD1194213.1 glycosyltransferase [Vulcanococcus sp. Clear-D1]
MPSLRFLVPGTTGRFRCGGLLVELQTARLVSAVASVDVVTYRQREPDYPFLADLLRQEPRVSDGGGAPAEVPLWIVSWGFDVPKLLRRLKGRPVAYHAHSSGYGFDLPASVPVVAVSRNTLGYWGDRAPRNPLFLVPNALDSPWLEQGARPGTAAAIRQQERCGLRRPIDVLVQQRKSSDYVLRQLVPALRARGLRVEVQSGWVDDLVELFNRSTVYLYDSADYWRGRGVSEGFGLPPIEALACGCVVFSSLNHALADHLGDGRLGFQIGCGTLQADVDRIHQAVLSPESWQPAPDALNSLLKAHDPAALPERWRATLLQIQEHWSRLGDGVRPLQAPSRHRLHWQARAPRLFTAFNRLMARSVP